MARQGRSPDLRPRPLGPTARTLAQLFWGPHWNEAHSRVSRPRRRSLPSYRIDLSAIPVRRNVTGLRLDPVYYARRPARRYHVHLVAAVPVDRRRRRGCSATPSFRFLEDFSSPLDGRWRVSRSGTGLARRSPKGGSSWPSRGPPFRRVERLRRDARVPLSLYDYDLQVDFRLLAWPERNGVSTTFDVNDRALFARASTRNSSARTSIPAGQQCRTPLTGARSAS